MQSIQRTRLPVIFVYHLLHRDYLQLAANDPYTGMTREEKAKSHSSSIRRTSLHINLDMYQWDTLHLLSETFGSYGEFFSFFHKYSTSSPGLPNLFANGPELIVRHSQQ
jgi:hypothetical protein